MKRFHIPWVDMRMNDSDLYYPLGMDDIYNDQHR